jgi:hypothetical protein
MSAKSAKKAKQVRAPRGLEEINKEYGQLCAQAGQLQYTITINNRSLEDLNKQILAINTEASQRLELDKAAKDEEVRQSNQSQAV